MSTKFQQGLVLRFACFLIHYSLCHYNYKSLPKTIPIITYSTINQSSLFLLNFQCSNSINPTHVYFYQVDETRATWAMAQSSGRQLLLTVWTLSAISRQTERASFLSEVSSMTVAEALIDRR